VVSQQMDVPQWVLYFAAGLFAVVFMALLIVLVIVLKIKRY
jgi:type IV secretory pathway component VirB8